MWTKSGHPDFPWLQEGELLADVFNEIRTKDGKLSIYTVDADKTNLTRIIVALASGRENFQDYEYVVVPKREIEENFEIDKMPGCVAHGDTIEEANRMAFELGRKSILYTSNLEDELMPPDFLRDSKASHSPHLAMYLTLVRSRQSRKRQSALAVASFGFQKLQVSHYSFETCICVKLIELN